MRNTSTTLKLLSAALLISMADPLWASGSVECKVVCSDDKACKVSDRPAAIKTHVSLSDCEQPSRTIVEGCADVFYHSRRTVQLAHVCKSAPIAAALKEPDYRCGGFFSCLMPLPPKPGPAGSPIGSDEQGSSSSGAKAGLPFNTIVMPADALKLSASGSSAQTTGKFSLWEFGSKRLVAEVPIVGGQATVQRASIMPRGAYSYRWEAGSQVLEGGFLTSSNNLRANLEETAFSSPTPMSAEQRQWKLVYFLSAEGYAWDAMQATLLLQQSQETSP